jgi:hypothetical protein
MINDENNENNENNLYIISADLYEKRIENNILILSAKPPNSDSNINLLNYKIIIKFIKKTCLVLKVGISMNLNKIKCKFAGEFYNVSTIKHFKILVEPGDCFEIELESLKKYFEIYIKVDEINIFNSAKLSNNLQIVYSDSKKILDWTSISNDESSKISIVDNNLNDLNLITTDKILIVKSVEIKKIIIVVSKFIKSIGEFFKLIFKSRGFECVIVHSLQLIDCIESTCDQMYLIVYWDQEHLALPCRYIFYQVEQSNSKFLTDPKLLKRTLYMMGKAEQVWEYSSQTSPIYSSYCKDKLKWVPMPYYYLPDNKQTDWDLCEYDIFFYGNPNKRRKKIIDILSKYFRVKAGWGYYGDKKIKYITKSKIILNLHYYKDAGLETCRINEILNYNKLIVSETSPSDKSNMQLYSDYVVFVDEIDDNFSNIEQMIWIIKNYLDKHNYQSKINTNKTKLSNKIKDLIKI